MAFAIKLEEFEGPLDLLLGLIESEKLDISQISLARVTDGYLGYLRANPGLTAEEMADFLVVASKLLLIKSRAILPFLEGQQEEAGELESQLRIYKEYLDASKTVSSLIGKRRFLFVHEKLPQVEIGFAPPKKLATAQMADIFGAVIRRLGAVVRLPSAVVEKMVSIHEKIEHIRRLIAKASRLSFKSVLLGAESRAEMVVNFLALLELIKQKSIVVTQEGIFDDITVKRAEKQAA